MKKIWFICICLAIACLAGFAAADELFVGVDGGYQSLTDAVLDADDGDVVHIAPGVYTGDKETYPVVIDKSIAVIGDDGVVLEGAPFETLLQISAPDVTLANISFRFLRWGIYNTGDRLNIQNCTFEMYDDTYRVSSCAVWLGGVYGCEVSGCTFSSCGVCIAGPPLSDSSKGLPVLTGLFEVGEDTGYFTSHSFLENTINGKPLYYFVNQTDVLVPADAGGVIAACCDGVQISGADVSDSSMGLEVVYCDNVQLHHVTADRCGIFGVYIAYCTESTLAEVQCTETNHGIDVRACDSIGITGCSTVDCEQGIFLSFTTQCVVDDCSIIGCGNGFFIAAGESNQFSNCIVKENENGIYVQNEADMLVIGNECTGNTAAAVRFLRSDGYVLDNSFMQNRTGILAAECNTLTVWGNSFSGNISAGLYLRDIAAGKVSQNIFAETETVFMQIDGSVLNTLIWNNTFHGTEDKIKDSSENGAVLIQNIWGE